MPSAEPCPVTLAADFEPDALVIRTSDGHGRSYNGFEWPRSIGAIVTCPDWLPNTKCGNGLHGLLDGIGDWSLTADGPNALWWIIGVRRDECIAIDDDKVKFPRGRVEYFGAFPGAMTRIMRAKVERGLILAKGNTATGYGGHAAATGYGGHAAATGRSGHAAATGYGGHATATGDSGHAAATGDSGHAAVRGKNAIAAALGRGGSAAAEFGGAIVVAAYDDHGNLVAIRAALVGQDGVEAGTRYRLTADGRFVTAKGAA